MIKLSGSDFHPHILKRMQERGVLRKEVEITLNEGIPERNTKQGTLGKRKVFIFNKEWCGAKYPEKEITVYYKLVNDRIVLLTVIARHGNFSHFKK